MCPSRAGNGEVGSETRGSGGIVGHSKVIQVATRRKRPNRKQSSRKRTRKVTVLHSWVTPHVRLDQCSRHASLSLLTRPHCISRLTAVRAFGNLWQARVRAFEVRKKFLVLINSLITLSAVFVQLAEVI